eukprot:CAMPEP_0168438486 /NCGR_PEP_ID=MMETSP0228-20121227/41985_1 /TAXON_ID=133427 /ORGANISM="Protoceratium reticulatum, Strain CCCM 535 (=CCMP 1889)" /LENGTH=52 /DNA_ID=CAMNT_0008452753 /DNA_START=1 /DNA_END=156 /DNA_ORIENTATION=+
MGLPPSQAGPSNRNADADEVELFIRANPLDDKAAQNLRSEPPRVQAAVLDRG